MTLERSPWTPTERTSMSVIPTVPRRAQLFSTYRPFSGSEMNATADTGALLGPLNHARFATPLTGRTLSESYALAGKAVIVST